MKRQLVILLVLSLLISIVLVACAGAATPTAAAPTSGSGAGTALDGKALVDSRCSACHSLSRVQQKRPASAWAGIVDSMIGKGAQLNNDEKAAVLQYLTTTYAQ